ncbi:hypothetical protein [Tranquillimonas alkanivorans]|uniref:PRC-barrel domain-containing protein n=1 Tax=Tranquillimonas alkanivorans TaxID=441119 RepID=A0A1I5Q0W5_9RHOB|nr:hypothetical protein [Tranquillimonas alkanivorans]SFP39903.1 hypothetical protein SAMN04488047_10618 [Tranquillimonas alkanivorans]
MLRLTFLLFFLLSSGASAEEAKVKVDDIVGSELISIAGDGGQASFTAPLGKAMEFNGLRQDRKVVGEVKDFVLDSNGAVVGAVVALEGLLDVSLRSVLIDANDLRVVAAPGYLEGETRASTVGAGLDKIYAAGAHRIVTHLSEEELRRLPRFVRDRRGSRTDNR